MNNSPSFRAINRFLLDLTDEQIGAMLANKNKTKQFLTDFADEAKNNSYFTALSDPEIIVALIETKRYTREQAEVLVGKWRNLATEHGYPGPVAWRVREGFTLKEHAPKAGKVYEDFKYLQDWKLQNDEPTKSAIVFWIPRILNNSKSKTTDQQKAIMVKTRKHHRLPKHHLSSFGSVALIVGLILAHLKRTGGYTPSNGELVRTETLHEDGNRLNLGFVGDALDCRNWDDVGGRDGDFGCFPLGLEFD